MMDDPTRNKLTDTRRELEYAVDPLGCRSSRSAMLIYDKVVGKRMRLHIFYLNLGWTRRSNELTIIFRHTHADVYRIKGKSSRTPVRSFT